MLEGKDCSEVFIKDQVISFDNVTSIERGTLSEKAFHQKAIVFAERWPSFSTVLESLGFDVSTFVVDVLTKNETVLEKIFINLPKPLKEFDKSDNFQHTTTSYWIQGSGDFVSSVLKLVPILAKSVTIIVPKIGRRDEIIETIPVYNLNKGEISHVTVGGITLSRWYFLVPPRVSPSLITQSTSVPRLLKHVLDHTAKGIPFGKAVLNNRKRKIGEGRIYTEDQRVLPGELRSTIITHCVRQSTTPNVKRYLTKSETMDVYDMQTSHQKVLTECNSSTYNTLMEHVVNSTPEKLIFKLVSQVKEHSLIDNENSETRLYSEKESSKAESELTWIKVNDESELNDQKAARNDDTAIETQQWDWYLIKNYNPDYQFSMLNRYVSVQSHWHQRRHKRPLVCTTQSPSISQIKLLNLLRDCSSVRFGVNTYRGFLTYMKSKYGTHKFTQCNTLHKTLRGNKRTNALRKCLKSQLLGSEFLRDIEIGTDAVRRACSSSFWDWDNGSTLFFWRWPSKFQKEARDGTNTFIQGELPRYKVSQQWPRDNLMKEKMKDKWLNVIDRRYIKPGPVISLTGSFAVPKGDSDVRMVYDATKCGLNEKLWAPNFMLPTIDMTLRHVDESGWFGDIDLGEMFLNFPLDTKLQPYTGIDATELKKELEKLDLMTVEQLESKGRLFLRWERCLMGLRSSPYNACKAMGWADDIIRGSRFDKFNIFRWDRFILNLPGMKNYNPSLPKGYKWNDYTNSMAGNFESYVDDIRSSHSSEHGCVLASRRIASLCNHLGIQDAARKRHFPTKKPRVWCGAKVCADQDGVYTSTTQAKWDRGKLILSDWLNELDQSEDNSLARKPMLSGRGFLVHLSRTYPALVPFMKGIHHTLENWRKGRNLDGWKFSRDEWRSLLSELEYVKSDFAELIKMHSSMGDQEAPARVIAVKRFERDIRSMLSLMENKAPPMRLVRGPKLAYVLYGFGDASGAGFGSSWETKEGTRFRFGVWGKDVSNRSSNYRELRNLVDSLEDMAN